MVHGRSAASLSCSAPLARRRADKPASMMDLVV
jgi:hypothetical protein